MEDSVDKQSRPKLMEEPVKKQSRSKLKEDSAEKQSRPKFFEGVKAEFKKISWPDKQSTLKQSIAVVAISIVVGIIIALLDVAIQFGVDFLTTI